MIEILDQGCQTKAPEAALFINSGGEVIRGDEVLDCSSVNLCEVRRRHGFSVDDVVNSRQLKGKKKKAWDDAVEAEFERKRQNDLDENERKFAAHVYSVQELVDFGRFRAYGQLNADGSELIVICTEFIGIVEDEKLWADIKALVERTKAHYWVMSEDPNLDHCYKVYQKGPKKGQKIPGSDKYGPNHGKLERQVELSWQVQDLSAAEIKRLVAKLKRQTEKLWPVAGVGVC